MNTGDAYFQIEALLPAYPAAAFELTADKWFAIAAILTLWIYVMLAPGRTPVEA